MSDDQSSGDLATFTAQLAGALSSAIQARPRGRGEDPFGGIITAGVVMLPPDPDRMYAVQDGLSRSGRRRATARSRITDLATGEAQGPEGIAALDDTLDGDPDEVLALLTALAEDPTLWAELFEVPARVLRKLRNPDPAALDELRRTIEVLSTYGGDLDSVVLRSGKAAAGGAQSRGNSNPWLPDKLEIKGEHDTATGGTKISATLTFDF